MGTKTGEICCRLCFCSDGNFLNIFNDVPSVFDIAKLLKKYFQDEVKLLDPLPNIICSDCWRKTESFHEFHEMVLSERKKYLNLHLDRMVIKMEPESILVAEIAGGQFDEFDVNACIDPITLKDKIHEGYKPSLLDCSLKEDDELSIIDDDGSNLDEYDCIIKTDYQFESHSSLGEDEQFEDDEDNDDDAQPEPENSSLPINIKELSTSQIQTVVTEHFDMNCEKCETKFSGFYEAKSHYQFAHNIARGYVKCCDLKIKEHKDYRSHVLWHLNPIVFDCLICGSSFKTLKSYHAHKHLHKNRALKRFICDICDATFPFKQKLERHIMQVHAAKKKYFCEECGNSFRTEKQFNMHNRYVHSGLDIQLTLERIEEFLRTNFDMECELKPCEKVFESLHDAKQHYLNVHNISNGWIKCCNNKFKFNKGISDHIAWHINPTVFQCVECGQLCNSRNNLKRHMMAHKEKRHTRQTYLEHEDEDLFECEYCRKTFLRKSKLIEHMKFIHEPEIQRKKDADLLIRFFDMTCDRCDDVFDSLEEASTHYIQMHNEQNGYIKCCSLQFNDISLAKDHLKWHLDPNIFKCDQCNEKLPTRKDLQSHIRASHLSRSFICDYCGKSFRAKQKVQKHMLRVHVNVKMKHRCGLCEKKFKYFKELHTHLELTHPDDLNNILIDTKNIPLLDLNDERMKAALQKYVDQACEICDVKLDNLAIAKSHYLTEHKKLKGYVICCGLRLKGEMALINHLNWHVNSNIFRCRLCLKIFGSRISIKAHIKKHEALQCKRYTCDTCSDIFPTIDDYRSHMEIKHDVKIPKRIYPEDESISNPMGDPVKEENLNYDMTPFDMTCDVDGCTTVFTSLSNARAHYLNVHTIPTGYIKCCDMKLRFQCDVKDHVAWHKEPGCFKCKDCGRDYKSNRALSRHTIEFHSKLSLLPKCIICKRRFKEKTELDAHMLLHQKQPKFPCPEPNCYKTFFKEGYLKIHRERHHNPTTEKKNYICEICGAETFKTFVQLKSHLSIVHKQGPQKPKRKYQCDICLKCYSSQGSLCTHKLTHSSDIHKCTLCEKVSPNAAALVCHMNAVHVEKKLNCTICDKKFKLASSLKDHIATHLNNKQWKCDYCDLEFYCRPNMYKHRKQIHRIEWEADKAKKEAERNKL